MPYGYGYDHGYEQGYAPFNPGYGHGAMVPWGGYGGTYVGVDPEPAKEKGMLEKAGDFLQEKAVDDIPNWALLGGAVAIGTIWWGYSQGWFD